MGEEQRVKRNFRFEDEKQVIGNVPRYLNTSNTGLTA